MAATVVIPARFASTRFPGKIIAADTGIPLVQHVVERARQCRQVREVIVACDDQRIVTALRPFGTRCVMTSPEHPSGTDRIAEVAKDLRDDIIVNVQGDEPEIEPATIDSVIELHVSDMDIGTAAAPFPESADPADPNLVKVVFTRDFRAMYFSRSPIPYRRDAHDRVPTYYLHVGIYAYRRAALLRLAELKPTACELAEKLEQLRALENGMSIRVSVIENAAHGIDTPQQYAAFVSRYRGQK
ncbi:MAG: 3-deoxy-manno-octulosonate cytidylyltransferase [Tepidisphaeraceae bacterium]